MGRALGDYRPEPPERKPSPPQPRYNPSNKRWHPPVHGTTADGKPVTVSFGKDGSAQAGNTGISDGHVSDAEYYERDSPGRTVGHDHYGPKGESYGDRGKYSDE